MGWVEDRARDLYAGIYGSDWQEVEAGVLQGPCPAGGAHGKRSAKTDCRLFLGYGPNKQPPGAYCLHSSCEGQLRDMNQRFRDAIFSERGERHRKPKDGVAPEPRGRAPGVPEYDEAFLRQQVASVPVVTPEWFMERSPIDPRRVTPGEFLETVFRPGERVLVFQDYFGQGDFGWRVGHGGCRLGKAEGVQPVRSQLPTDGGKDGIWYLCQPVDGKWHPNMRRDGRPSRRSEESVTAWRHLVLESDDAPEDLWLRFLARLTLQVLAIYSSGGRSWHALVLVDMASKADWDGMCRHQAKKLLPKFGADPGAMTGVRLTRLPGCTRNGKLQRLIYLNPRPNEPIIELPKRREVAS